MFAIKTIFNLQLMGFHFHEEIINKLHIYIANTFLCVENLFRFINGKSVVSYMSINLLC